MMTNRDVTFFYKNYTNKTLKKFDLKLFLYVGFQFINNFVE